MSSTKNPIHRLFGVDAAEHGRSEPVKPDPNINLQVINLGLSRTGTTSMGAALEILGFGPCHEGVDVFRFPSLREGWTSILQDINTGHTTQGPAPLSTRIQHLLRGYRSGCDHPVNQIPSEIYHAYPQAKYILTTRTGGAAEWWPSFSSAVGVHFRSDWSHYLFMFLLYPVGFLRRMNVQIGQNRIMWTKRFGAIDAGMYNKHNAMVKELIPEHQLLVFNVKEGWGPLCKFLDVDVPEGKEFPKLNELKSMKTIFFGMQCLGACVWGIYLGVVVGGLCLVKRPEVLRGFMGGVLGWVSNVVSRLRFR